MFYTYYDSAHVTVKRGRCTQSTLGCMLTTALGTFARTSALGMSTPGTLIEQRKMHLLAFSAGKKYLLAIQETSVIVSVRTEENVYMCTSGLFLRLQRSKTAKFMLINNCILQVNIAKVCQNICFRVRAEIGFVHSRIYDP